MIKVNTAQTIGLEARIIQVQANTVTSPSQLIIHNVWNPVAAKELRVRVLAAMKNSVECIVRPNCPLSIQFSEEVTKDQPLKMDLPMALAILHEKGRIDMSRCDDLLFVGELMLSGSVRPVRGIYPIARTARDLGLKVVTGHSNALEASMVDGLDVYGINTLADAVELIQEGREPFKIEPPPLHELHTYKVCMSDIQGLEMPKRALEVAAAGGHNILLIGPPGSGKTMLARRLASILPPMDRTELEEARSIHSIAGFGQRVLSFPPDTTPFRAPHHTISDAGLFGGGMMPRPGEVSLAHGGVLFLDEIHEFRGHVLKQLPRVCEHGFVPLRFGASDIKYPAHFHLVGSCVEQSKRLEPVMACFPMRVQIQGPPTLSPGNQPHGDTSLVIKERVIAARTKQVERFAGTHVQCNDDMGPGLLDQFSNIEMPAIALLGKAVERFKLSDMQRINAGRIAQTIADLEGSEVVKTRHVAEAVLYVR